MVTCTWRLQVGYEIKLVVLLPLALMWPEHIGRRDLEKWRVGITEGGETLLG